MANGNGTKTRNIIYIIVSAAVLLGMLATVAKTYFILPEQVTTQAAQNTKEHTDMQDDIETLDDEGMAIVMDVVEIKGNIKHIITEQGHQEIRQKERHVEILNKIKELHE